MTDIEQQFKESWQADAERSPTSTPGISPKTQRLYWQWWQDEWMQRQRAEIDRYDYTWPELPAMKTHQEEKA